MTKCLNTFVAHCSSLKREESYLDQCWLECLGKGICLPTHWLYLEDHENPNKVRRIATDFLSENGETDVQIESRKSFEDSQREEDDESVGGHIDSRQDDDDDDDDDYDGDKEDDHEIEVLISVKVTSADDDILVQDEENLPSDEMFPQEERYTEHLHASTKGVGETIQRTTNSETEINSSCVLHVNQEQPPLDSDITAGTCFAQRKENEKAGDHSLQTKLGKAVETVLGHTKEVEQFDLLRSRLKSNQGNNFLYEKYMNELASIQTKVLNKHNSLKTELKDWEKLYFIENNFKSPTMSDVMQSSKGSQILKTLRYTKALLKEWKIELD